MDGAANLVMVGNRQAHATVAAVPLDTRNSGGSVGIARVNVSVDEQVHLLRSGATHRNWSQPSPCAAAQTPRRAVGRLGVCPNLPANAMPTGAERQGEAPQEV